MKKYMFVPVLLLLAACLAPVVQAPSPAAGWQGRWTGPEGTLLDIAGRDDAYNVTIQSLDGPAAYQATPTPEGLSFTRDGRPEAIHAGNGRDTGMKWLMDKKNCLVIKPGEGFCRD